MKNKELPPETKKRNRILFVVLIVIALAVVALTVKGIYKTDFDRDKLEEIEKKGNTY